MVQVDRKYVFSLGAHFTHRFVLLSNAHSISFATARDICVYLSFLFDSPVTCDIDVRGRDPEGLRRMRTLLRLRGEVARTKQDVERIVVERHALLSELHDQFTRCLPASQNGRVVAFDLPSDRHLADGLLAYQQALFSVDPVGQILNYWRVVEATSRSLQARRSLIAELRTRKLQGVPCERLLGSGRSIGFNLVRRQLSVARRQIG